MPKSNLQRPTKYSQRPKLDYQSKKLTPRSSKSNPGCLNLIQKTPRGQKLTTRFQRFTPIVPKMTPRSRNSIQKSSNWTLRGLSFPPTHEPHSDAAAYSNNWIFYLIQLVFLRRVKAKYSICSFFLT